MNKNISLLLAAMIIGGIFPQISYGIVNPLKNYDLYADTHREIIKEQKAKKVLKTPPKEAPTTELGEIKEVENVVPQRRNDYLRESSRKVFGDGKGNWLNKPYFYEKPTLNSIIKKYRLSNFAGCMQECESYVKMHPSDTLGFYYLAMSYAKCGKKEDAILAYEKVISLNDNPMIVKYATNGRNCVIGNEKDAKCFQNVNEPELLYPYKEMAKDTSLMFVNPQDLIDKNLEEVTKRINKTPEGTKDGESTQIQSIFGNQDESLDKFINAPYGSGFSPELEKEYKQLQLKNIQEEINRNNPNYPGKYFENLRDIKNFDNNKSESESIKLAMADNMDVADIFNSPEYIQNKKELDEIKMMFGEYNSSQDKSNDLTTILPEMAKDGNNISPEVVQMMVMQSIMPNIISTDTNSGF